MQHVCSAPARVGLYYYCSSDRAAADVPPLTLRLRRIGAGLDITVGDEVCVAIYKWQLSSRYQSGSSALHPARP